MRGVAGVIQFTTMGRGAWQASRPAVSTPLTYPLLTAAIGFRILLLHPVKRRPVGDPGFRYREIGDGSRKSASSAAILALGIGDHMGNLMSPVLVRGGGGPSCGSTSARFFGYGLVFAAIWFAIGVMVFTFAPC